jgi:hypothetical protein
MSITINGTTGIAGVDGSAATPSVQGADANTGVFFPAADTVAVTTGGSERMRVDSSGNVGIGTTTPNAKFEIAATVPDIRLTAGGSLITNFYASASGTTLITVPAAPLFFGTNNTERMRIGSSGEIGIGGANYGTSGQVLTSGGSGAAPSWATVRGFASTTITNTSRASGTAFQNTTSGTMLVTVVGQNNGAQMFAGATAGSLFQVSRQNATYTAVSCMIPPGWYYQANYSVLNSWIEGQ